MSDSTNAAGLVLRNPAGRVSVQLRELGMQLRADAGGLTDPRTRRLFATTADLLVTLERAFADAEA